MIQRLHSLDSMRAILMLIGVYFHIAHAYTDEPNFWSRNPETVSAFFSLFNVFTHYFRMHAFFLIAGFFGALLYERKGGKEMLKNRFKRLYLPLLVFSWPLWILNGICSEFAKNQANGSDIINSFSASFTIFSSVEGLIPFMTQHLWFLNFLFIMSFFAFVIKYILDVSKYYGFVKDRIPTKTLLGRLVGILFTKPMIGTTILCITYGLLMVVLGIEEAQGANAWWAWFPLYYPSGIKSFIAFGFFYFIGWHIYYHLDNLSKLRTKKQFLLVAILIPVCFYATFSMVKYSIPPYPFVQKLFENTIHENQPAKKVTFQIDLAKFDFSEFENDESSFRGVYLQGDFNNWCGECDKMEDEDGDLIFTKTVDINPGIIDYIFTINGWDGENLAEKKQRWLSGPYPDSECDALPGNEDNTYSIKVADKEIILDPVCWLGDCLDCKGNQVYHPLQHDIPDSITYSVLLLNKNRLKLSIPNKDGYWTFTFDRNSAGEGIVGNWKLSPIEGAYKVGPSPDDGSSWQNTIETLTKRSCLFDDEYVFKEDGRFKNIFGGETWNEAWQKGVDADECGVPVFPHNGAEIATYNYNEDAKRITLFGPGAFLGIAKVFNGGEYTDNPKDIDNNQKYGPYYSSFIFLYNFMVPAVIMLLLSLFVNIFNTESRRMRYISDASYWVYIIHLPLTHLIPGFFHGSSINVFLKFGLSSIIITVICFYSYHYLVRTTFIGQFLNGRKYFD